MSTWLTIVAPCLISALGLRPEDLKSILPSLKLVVPDDSPARQESLPPGAIARFGEPSRRRLMSEHSIFSPDGRMVAIGGEEFVELRNAKDGSCIRELRPARPAEVMAFTADSRQLAVSEKGAVRIFSTADGRELAQLPIHDFEITALVFSRDGTRLLCGSADDWVCLWDVVEQKLLKQKQLDGGGPIAHLCFSPNGSRIGIGPRYGLPRVWDSFTWKDVCRLDSRRGIVEAISFMPNGKFVAVISGWGAWIYELERGDTVGFLDDTEGLCAISADGRLLAATLPDNRADPAIRIYDLTTEKRVATLRGHRGGVTRILFAPDGKTLHSMGRDCVPRAWDAATGKEIGRASGHQGAVTGVAFRNDSNEVISASHDGTVRFWDPATGKEVRRLVAVGEFFLTLDCSRDGKTAALLSTTMLRDGFKFPDTKPGHRYRFVDPDSGKRIAEGELPEFTANHYAISADHWFVERADAGPPTRIHVPDNETMSTMVDDSLDSSLSPDGRIAVGAKGSSSDEGSRIRCFSLPSGQLRFERTISASYVDKPIISPSSLLIAVAGNFWNEPPTEERGAVAAFCARDIIAMAFSEKRTEADYHLQIWDARGDLIRDRISVKHCPELLRFSPDGRLLAAADKGGITVYEAHTGREYRRFDGHLGVVTCMAFSGDNRLLATGSDDTTLLVWDVAGLDANTKSDDVKLDREDPGRCWNDLADANPASARQALWHFVKGGDAGLPVLEAHLDIPSAADLRRVRALILRLDAERFADRQAASRELARIGLAVRPVLERARSESASLEIREAAARLLGEIGVYENVATDSRLRRAIRVVEILERVDTPKAKELLKLIRLRGCYNLQRREAEWALARP